MDLESQISAFEQLCHVSICLHDHCGILKGSKPQQAMHRASHRKTYPDACGSQRRAACLECCLHDVGRRIDQRRERVFLKRCQFGALEVVAPLYKNSEHVGTLFAGLWRPVHSHAQFKAPVWDKRHIRSVMLLLPVFADGIMAAANRHNLETLGDGRRAIIQNYIEAFCRSSIKLQALGERLGLSPTRAGHLVKELTGKTFSELVLEKRTENAISYIVGTDYRMKEIAALAGFGTPEHFCRTFQKKYHKSPAQFRNDAQRKFLP